MIYKCTSTMIYYGLVDNTSDGTLWYTRTNLSFRGIQVGSGILEPTCLSEVHVTVIHVLQ